MCGGNKETTVEHIVPEEDKKHMTAKDSAQLAQFDKELEANRDKFANGPIGQRSITDCLCCLIFIAAIVGWIACSAYGWTRGDPRKLLIGWDSDGNGCGYTDVTKEYPYLYWPQPPDTSVLTEAIKTLDYKKALGLLKYGSCVKACPSADQTTIVDCKQTSYMASNKNYSGCSYSIGTSYLTEWGIDVAKYTGSTTTIPASMTFPFRYDTTNLFGFCVPQVEVNSKNVSALGEKAVETIKSVVNSVITTDKLTSYIADIAFSWQVILISSGTAIVLGYLYLILIRCMGALIVWLSIVFLQCCIIGGGVYVFFYSNTYPEDSQYRQWVKYFAYGIWGVAGLYFICICCCYRAIRIGIAVYQATAQYVSSNLRIFFLPLIAYIFAGIWFAAWLISAIFVTSVGTPMPREDYVFITEIKWEVQTRYIFIYQLFLLFWLNAWIMGLCQFIIGASACIWYFEVNSDTKGAGTVGRGMWWALRYHMGSVAFGAALIAICQLIRVIFEYYRRKIQMMNKNACVKFMLCITSYLLWVLEKCVKFITKNAYIQVALSNTNFCKSAWNAFALILKNVAKFGWLHTIGFVLNWFGVCSITACNCFAAYVALTRIDYFKIRITQALAPAVVIALMTFFIVKSFLSIFSFSLDAILQSFLLDESLGFAGQARPDYISKFKTTLETNAPKTKE